MNKNSFYGAIIGDIVGSVYEVNEMKAKEKSFIVPFDERVKILDKNTPLFSENCDLTDDSVLTLAIANALITDKDYEENLRFFGKREQNLGLDKYGRSRFGQNFLNWINNNGSMPSYGNGCAMRISPIGYAFDTLKETLSEAEKATIPTHNKPECITFARATAGAIFLARKNKSKEEIKDFIINETNLTYDYNLEYLQRNYIFTSKTVNSVPYALYCFLISENFEDCLRKSISIGGDTDTIAAIACSIAGAYYGIDDELIKQAKPFINCNYQNIIDDFNKKYVEKCL